MVYLGMSFGETSIDSIDKDKGPICISRYVFRMKGIGIDSIDKDKGHVYLGMS